MFKKADGEGKTLYDHLTNVLLTIAKEQPADPLAAFESLSVKVKAAGLQVPQLKEAPASLPAPDDKVLETRAYVQLVRV